MDVYESFLVAHDNLATLPLCHSSRLMADKEMILLPTPSFHHNSSVLQPFSLTRTDRHWQSRKKAIIPVFELFFCNPLSFSFASAWGGFCILISRENTRLRVFSILFFPMMSFFSSRNTVYQYLIS